jgi:dTDP-4-amino-4,6-dideoxygalactose transaminase
VQDDVVKNYAYMPVVFDDQSTRDKVQQTLSDHEIFTRKYFYPISQLTDAYKNTYHGETPIAKDISERVLTLPIYADLDIADVEKICIIILRATNE